MKKKNEWWKLSLLPKRPEMWKMWKNIRLQCVSIKQNYNLNDKGLLCIHPRNVGIYKIDV